MKSGARNPERLTLGFGAIVCYRERRPLLDATEQRFLFPNGGSGIPV